jgi:hypothetical protein
VIQIRRGDLVEISSQGHHYYCLVLDQIRMFGGNWTYVFHGFSNANLTADQVLERNGGGFHAFVDFIHAKREGRLRRLARSVDIRPYTGPGYLKRSLNLDDRYAGPWVISDMNFRDIRRVGELSEEEAKYPLEERITDSLMVERAEKRWTPSQARH